MTYSIDPQHSALLIIDAQREYFDPERPLFTPHASEILENLVRLRQEAKRSGMKVILIQHVHRADGSDVGRMGDFDPTPVFVEGTTGAELIPELKPDKDDLIIAKTRYSAFVDTTLQATLKSSDIDTVIITGLMTNYCCVTTARHAHDLDYKVVFVADANAGPDMPDLGFGPVPHADIMKAVATSLAGGISDVITTDELLMLLTKSELEKAATMTRS